MFFYFSAVKKRNTETCPSGVVIFKKSIPAGSPCIGK